MNDEKTEATAQSRREFCVVGLPCRDGGGAWLGPAELRRRRQSRRALVAAAARRPPLDGGQRDGHAGGAVTVDVDGASPLAAGGRCRAGALDRAATSWSRTPRRTRSRRSRPSARTRRAPSPASAARPIVCPCHGSQYSTAGQVLSGPATRSLRTLPDAVHGHHADHHAVMRSRFDHRRPGVLHAPSRASLAARVGGAGLRRRAGARPGASPRVSSSCCVRSPWAAASRPRPAACRGSWRWTPRSPRGSPARLPSISRRSTPASACATRTCARTISRSARATASSAPCCRRSW